MQSPGPSEDMAEVKRPTETWDFLTWTNARTANLNGNPSTNTRPPPIPLRTLTTLLNYERCVTNPRFFKRELLNTTVAVPEFFRNPPPLELEYQYRIQKLQSEMSSSVIQFRVHKFATNYDLKPQVCTADDISSNAPANLHELSDELLDQIYYETRGADGCFKAVGMLEAFFDLCPSNQQISIQLRNEEPVLVNPLCRVSVAYETSRPKVSVITTGIRGDFVHHDSYSGKDGYAHAIVTFSKPGSNEQDYVVDMSRAQYGVAGRGLFGEPYFIGTADEFFLGFSKICDLEAKGFIFRLPPSDSEITYLGESCAARVWDRWQNREQEGWCAYCGVGDTARYPLMQCSGCKDKKVEYCCTVHRKLDWKLHYMTCERK